MDIEEYKKKLYLYRGREYKVKDESFNNKHKIDVDQYSLIYNNKKINNFKCMAYELLYSNFTFNDKIKYLSLKRKIEKILKRNNIKYEKDVKIKLIPLENNLYMPIYIDFVINNKFIISLDWVNSFNNFIYHNSYFDKKHKLIRIFSLKQYKRKARFFNIMNNIETAKLDQYINKIIKFYNKDN